MTSDERNDAIPYSQSRFWIVYWQKRPGEEDHFSPRSKSSLNKFKMGAGSQNRQSNKSQAGTAGYALPLY